jgi:hypothetical protein
VIFDETAGSIETMHDVGLKGVRDAGDVETLLHRLREILSPIASDASKRIVPVADCPYVVAGEPRSYGVSIADN